ncbi:MAG: RlmE family RNA methyltransferase [Myxococcota bacterium]
MPRYNKQDRFHQRAKDEQYAARSVYKLEEIDRRYDVIGRGDKIVDVGCAPGSWLQYLARAVGKKGCVVGYDLEPVTVNAGSNVRAFEANIEELDPERVLRELAELSAELRKKPAPASVPPSFGAHVFVSDMAPKLSGVRDADQAKQAELVGTALDLALAVLLEGGHFVAKMFQGRDTDPLLDRAKHAFEKVRFIKPEATREGSREVFIVALGLKARIQSPERPTRSE